MLEFIQHFSRSSSFSHLTFPFSHKPLAEESNQGSLQILHCEIPGQNTCEARDVAVAAVVIVIVLLINLEQQHAAKFLWQWQSVILHVFPCHRRDKYERNIREFWVDVATTGAFERENEETLCDKTGAEGTAVSFDLGLPAEQPQVDDRGPPSDPDDSDAEVGSGNEDDSDRSTRTKVPRPGDVQEESVFEAHPNQTAWMLCFNQRKCITDGTPSASTSIIRPTRTSQRLSTTCCVCRAGWIHFMRRFQR